MLRVLAVPLLAIAAAAPLAAQPNQPLLRDNPQIDFAGFRRLATEVEPYRQTRLIDWAEFDRLRGQRDVLILDARSESAFRRGHIRGAVNLPFTDFTAQSLARVIGPDRDRSILIYCNNNFSNNRQPVMLKSVQLALNIQTFINLVGYGYRNVRELNDVVDFNTPAVRWVRG
ncbi:rhodanese-like domain-containing protein [Allosphingosinicella sp.]|uniref:rhodanese-like domain-containing protein n=1 Tax=Allosphingosinicella sp. TaxID=2823234 RepID=UPI00378479D0